MFRFWDYNREKNHNKIKLFYQPFSAVEDVNIVSAWHTTPDAYNGMFTVNIFTQHTTVFQVFHINTLPGFIIQIPAYVEQKHQYFDGPNTLYPKMYFSQTALLSSTGHMMTILFDNTKTGFGMLETVEYVLVIFQCG